MYTSPNYHAEPQCKLFIKHVNAYNKADEYYANLLQYNQISQPVKNLVLINAVLFILIQINRINTCINTNSTAALLKITPSYPKLINT